MMNKKIKELVSGLIGNINGMTEYEKLGLPIEADGIKIEYIDGRVFVTAPDGKVSYFFTHTKYINNLDLLQRIMFIYGVELFGDSPLSIRTFKKEIVEKLKEEK